MGAVLGLLAALSITTTEFFSRRISNEAGPLTSAATVSLLASLAVVPIALLTGSEPTLADMALGTISGIGFGIGMASYLHGVRISSSAVIGPTSASLTTLIPFTYAAIVEAVPPTLAIIGAATILVGLLFVTIGGEVASNVRGGLPMGILSGLGFGIGTALLVDISDDAGAWPAAGQRAMAFVTIAVFATSRGRPVILPTRFAPHAGAAGLFAGLSTALLLAGLAIDAPSTAVTSSLFPATSVVVGRALFGDSVSRPQVIGLATVIAGTFAIVLA